MGFDPSLNELLAARARPNTKSTSDLDFESAASCTAASSDAASGDVVSSDAASSDVASGDAASSSGAIDVAHAFQVLHANPDADAAELRRHNARLSAALEGLFHSKLRTRPLVAATRAWSAMAVRQRREARLDSCAHTARLCMVMHRWRRRSGDNLVQGVCLYRGFVCGMVCAQLHAVRVWALYAHTAMLSQLGAPCDRLAR